MMMRSPALTNAQNPARKPSNGSPSWFVRALAPSSAALSGIIVAGALLVVISACTSEPSKPAEAPKPETKGPELLTGRSAFQKLYVAARGWSSGAQPFRIESLVTTDGNGQDGKAAQWRASFGSPAQRLAKAFTWSGTGPADTRGVNPGIEDSFSPTNASTQVFDANFLKVDSDQALATAQKHGGDKVLEKNPDTVVSYLCDWNHNTNELVWHVIYGNKLRVSVNASTGEFIRVEK
jgi:hypothetical protein